LDPRSIFAVQLAWPADVRLANQNVARNRGLSTAVVKISGESLDSSVMLSV
jgi:hypothetical protein